MFKTIVWASDGSEAADRALAYAKELASAGEATLHAVHSDEHLVGGRSAGVPVQADEPELESKIRSQVDTARTEGLEASFEIVRCASGRSPHAIADFARSVEADVIVVGTRGHSPLTGALLGSVTQGLLHLAPCPVLAIPPTVVTAPGEKMLAAAGR